MQPPPRIIPGTALGMEVKTIHLYRFTKIGSIFLKKIFPLVQINRLYVHSSKKKKKSTHMDFKSKESKEMKNWSTSEKKSPTCVIFQAMKSIELRIFLVWPYPWKVCCQRILELLGASESRLERRNDHNVILSQAHKDAVCNIVQGA